MALKCYLEVVEGPRQGERIQLKAGQGAMIGRTKQGIDLLDPRVSTRHAELYWEQDRFWVRDLGSATGTVVDGIALGQEPAPLSVGTTIVVGDSTLVFREERRAIPQWVYWAALVVLAIATPFFLQTVIDLNLWDRLHPSLQAPEAVYGHRGFLALADPNEVTLDRCFMRETGASADNVSIRRVTDWDGDGVNEIWVEGSNWERVYTFDSDGNWQLLGELPKGCQNSEGAGFRTMTCGDPAYASRVYEFKPGVPFQPGPGRCAMGSNKGHYELERVKGAIVWVPGGAGKAPKPWHMNVKDDRRALATWLGERGIERPVHFIVCEETFPNLGAQVLTEDGRIERLQPGCAGTLDIEGPMASSRYGRARPAAVAFTQTGHDLLLEQLNVFLGGSTRDHFQNPFQKQWLREFADTPQVVTSDLLTFDAQPDASERFFRAVASENKRLVLDRFERLSGLQVPGIRRAGDWTWAAPQSVINTPCGAYVNVSVNNWRCGPPCFSTSKFLKISQIGGPTWELPYHDLRNRRFQGNGIELSVTIQTAGAGMVPQAVAATVAARDSKVCAAPDLYKGPPVIEEGN